MIQAKATRNQDHAIIRRLSQPEYDRLAVNTQEGLVVVRFRDITYCEAMSNYCRIHLTGGRTLVVSKALKHIARVLPDDQFIRIHQTYLVRYDGIALLGQHVHLSDGKVLPVSRNRRSEVTQRLRLKMPFV